MVKWWMVLGTIALAACSDSPSQPGPNVPVTIQISAPTTILSVGHTSQFGAIAFDSKGVAISTATITWSTSAVAVATVTETGLVTAVTVGEAKITARSGNASSDITVFVTNCSPPLSLSVGDICVFNGADVSNVTVAAAAGASDYLVIATNTRPRQDDTLAYSLSVASVSSSIAAPDLFSAPAPAQSIVGPPSDAVEVVDARIRSYERSRVEPLMPELARRSATRTAPSSSRVSLAQLAVAVGDTLSLRVPNLNTGKDICADNIAVRGVVKAITGKAVIVQDVNAPAGGFSTGDFNTIGSEFDNLIFPTDTSWFGAPTDINKDGHVTILYTPEVNKLTPSGATGFTAGFFFGIDLLLKTDFTATDPCRNMTNEEEIFYVLSPDPTGTFNNVRSTATVRQNTRGVIAHEFQHMINQGVRQFNPAVTALETFWLNEGLSHLAEETVGRAARGFGDFQRLSFAQASAVADDYQAFFRQNFSRFQRWMLRPDTSSPVSVRNKDQLAPRGASWALIRYAIDQYSNGAARAFTRALDKGPETDIPNFLARTKVAFDQIVTGWLVANFTEGLNIAGLPTRAHYTSWNIRDVEAGVNNNAFPLTVNAFSGTFQNQALSGSGNYYRLTRPAGSAAAAIQMTAQGGGPVSSSFATVIVVRLN